MPELDKFRTPDGKIDMTAYNAACKDERDARKAKGEICMRCGGFMLWAKGYPRQCGDCDNLKKGEELHHPSDVRCPACGYSWRVGDGDDYELYQEGIHELNCPDCDEEFEVKTWVRHTFVSPVMKTPKDKP